jgi:predicted polyphosphate/ATP-dependent NAD kinase
MGNNLESLPPQSFGTFRKLVTNPGVRQSRRKKKLGLIVNPIAGIGGRVGLKGSDGIELQKQAFAKGAEPISGKRATQALERLKSRSDDLQIHTYPGEMGADVCLSLGFQPKVFGSISPGKTTAKDTISAARQFLDEKVDLILFAGGDGTARDIYSAVGQEIPALGIPAGVKIQSGVFARNPVISGDIALHFLFTEVPKSKEAEVMDVDEELYRRGKLASRLFGYLLVPCTKKRLQGIKTAIAPSRDASLADIASEVISRMQPDLVYILGPGTTPRAITQALGLEKTLLGIDVIKSKQIILKDADEKQLLEVLEKNSGRIIVTPIGGQGFLFGRGNQQISPEVIRKIGSTHIWVICVPEKIFSLAGRPLLVDSGDLALDEELSGYISVITGYHESIIYPVAS